MLLTPKSTEINESYFRLGAICYLTLHYAANGYKTWICPISWELHHRLLTYPGCTNHKTAAKSHYSNTGYENHGPQLSEAIMQLDMLSNRIWAQVELPGILNLISAFPVPSPTYYLVIRTTNAAPHFGSTRSR